MGHSATQIVGVIESLDGARPAEGVFQSVVFVSHKLRKTSLSCDHCHNIGH